VRLKLQGQIHRDRISLLIVNDLRRYEKKVRSMQYLERTGSSTDAVLCLNKHGHLAADGQIGALAIQHGRKVPRLERNDAVLLEGGRLDREFDGTYDGGKIKEGSGAPKSVARDLA